MKKIENLLQDVLTRYPELHDYKFSIKYSSLPDAYAQYSFDSNHIEIEVDNTIKNRKDSLKIAAVATELSHIIKDKKLSRIIFGIFLDRFLHSSFRYYRQKDERNADIETMRRGFGKEEKMKNGKNMKV